MKSEIYMQLDVMDQQQIVAAATGEVIDELVYQVKGKTAISWMGINHICFFMGDIEVNEPKETQWERIVMFGDRVYWSATIRARNMKYGLSSLGTAEAPELADVHVLNEDKSWAKNPDGSWMMTLREDPHCRRKALSMAQRNGKRAVIPAAVLKKWLEYFLKLKKGETVDPPFQPKYVESTQEPPKKTDRKRTSRKKTEKKATKATQLSLGEVNGKTVTYNLHAAGFDEDVVGVLEEGDYVLVEPMRELSEEEIYKISGTLESDNAKFEETGYFGQWRIPKRAKHEE